MNRFARLCCCLLTLLAWVPLAPAHSGTPAVWEETGATEVTPLRNPIREDKYICPGDYVELGIPEIQGACPLWSVTPESRSSLIANQRNEWEIRVNPEETTKFTLKVVEPSFPNQAPAVYEYTVYVNALPEIQVGDNPEGDEAFLPANSTGVLTLPDIGVIPEDQLKWTLVEANGLATFQGGSTFEFTGSATATLNTNPGSGQILVRAERINYDGVDENGNPSAACYVERYVCIGADCCAPESRDFFQVGPVTINTSPGQINSNEFDDNGRTVCEYQFVAPSLEFKTEGVLANTITVENVKVRLQYYKANNASELRADLLKECSFSIESNAQPLDDKLGVIPVEISALEVKVNSSQALEGKLTFKPKIVNPEQLGYGVRIETDLAGSYTYAYSGTGWEGAWDFSGLEKLKVTWRFLDQVIAESQELTVDADGTVKDIFIRKKDSVDVEDFLFFESTVTDDNPNSPNIKATAEVFALDLQDSKIWQENWEISQLEATLLVHGIQDLTMPDEKKTDGKNSIALIIGGGPGGVEAGAQIAFADSVKVKGIYVSGRFTGEVAYNEKGEFGFRRLRAENLTAAWGIPEKKEGSEGDDGDDKEEKKEFKNGFSLSFDITPNSIENVQVGGGKFTYKDYVFGFEVGKFTLYPEQAFEFEVELEIGDYTKFEVEEFKLIRKSSDDWEVSVKGLEFALEVDPFLGIEASADLVQDSWTAEGSAYLLYTVDGSLAGGIGRKMDAADPTQVDYYWTYGRASLGSPVGIPLPPPVSFISLSEARLGFGRNYGDPTRTGADWQPAKDWNTFMFGGSFFIKKPGSLTSQVELGADATLNLEWTPSGPRVPGPVIRFYGDLGFPQLKEERYQPFVDAQLELTTNSLTNYVGTVDGNLTFPYGKIVPGKKNNYGDYLTLNLNTVNGTINENGIAINGTNIEGVLFDGLIGNRQEYDASKTNDPPPTYRQRIANTEGKIIISGGIEGRMFQPEGGVNYLTVNGTAEYQDQFAMVFPPNFDATDCVSAKNSNTPGLHFAFAGDLTLFAGGGFELEVGESTFDLKQNPLSVSGDVAGKVLWPANFTSTDCLTELDMGLEGVLTLQKSWLFGWRLSSQLTFINGDEEFQAPTISIPY